MQAQQFNKATPFDISEALMAYRQAEQNNSENKYRNELMQAQLLKNKNLSGAMDRRQAKYNPGTQIMNVDAQNNTRNTAMPATTIQGGVQPAVGDQMQQNGAMNQQQFSHQNQGSGNDQIANYLPEMNQSQNQFSSAQDLEDALIIARADDPNARVEWGEDKNGNSLAMLPNGDILNMGHIFQSTQDREDSKYRAQQKNDLEDKYLESATEGYVIDELDSLFDSGIFDDINQNAALFGKWNNSFYKAFGNDDQNSALARAAVLTGELVTNMSTRFKGVFRAGEQRLVESMKPDINRDSPAMLKAKTQALKEMNTLFSQRQKYMLDIMDANPSLPRHKALDMANKYINEEKIKEAANLKKYIPQEMKISPEQLEHTMNKYNLTEEQVRNHLKNGTMPDDEKENRIAKELEAMYQKAVKYGD